jgi:hypothetical protein
VKRLDVALLMFTAALVVLMAAQGAGQPSCPRQYCHAPEEYARDDPAGLEARAWEARQVGRLRAWLEGLR